MIVIVKEWEIELLFLIKVVVLIVVNNVIDKKKKILIEIECFKKFRKLV